LPALSKFVSRVDLRSAKVDRESGVIKSVSICSIGDAKGHDKLCDKTTLEQLRDCIRTYDSGLKVKFNPDSFNHGDAGIAGRIPGDTLRIKSGKLVGDLHVYKNYPAKDYLFEIAEESPDHFGLSVEFSGVDEEKDDQTFARCTEIYAAAVVDLPAANPTGLFAANGDGKKPYGDVEYADPGYQEDKKKRYPIDTEDHCRAAWSYINKEENASKYSSGDLSKIKARIKSAAKEHGIEISEENKESAIMDEQTITKLAAAIGQAVLKPLQPLIDFAKKKQEEDGDEPTEDEMNAAGIEDGDDEKTKKDKMRVYRNALKQPLSKADLMEFFRKTGGKPARHSAADDDVIVNSDKVKRGEKGTAKAFRARVDGYVALGVSKPLAIARAKKDDPKGYGEDVKQGFKGE